MVFAIIDLVSFVFYLRALEQSLGASLKTTDSGQKATAASLASRSNF